MDVLWEIPLNAPVPSQSKIQPFYRQMKLSIKKYKKEPDQYLHASCFSPTLSELFFEIILSTLVSDLYGLIQRLIYLIFVGPHFKFTVTLVKQYVIKNGTIYGVLYLYAVCLVIMNLTLTL